MPVEPVPSSEQKQRTSKARSTVVKNAAAKRPRKFEVGIGETAISTSKAIQNLFKNYEPLGYMLPWESLDYIELLATYNADYSQAVDNIRTLANSGHNLFVEAGSALETRKTKELLEDKARGIQEQHGGVDGLIDKLLKQGSVYGAMAGEWILNEDLTDVVDFRDLNPKSIRFLKREDQTWQPYQKVNMKEAKEAQNRGLKVKNDNYIELNPLTFRYFAFDAAPSSPYGTPPFVAALAPIAMQRDMLGNMGQIVKKLGLLGIVDLVVKFPQKTVGESEAEYEARISAYLDDYVQVVEDMVKDGGLVHFDDVEVKTYALAGNAAGATNIFKQIEEQVFSGLKSMPSVQGRSYSTTETYAGVAYDIIIRNTFKYQRAVKRMIEAGYWLTATMNGRNPQKINIEFNTNKTLQRLQTAQAEEREIKNAVMLWLIGLLDQVGVAQRLGFNEPKIEMENPPETPLLDTGSGGAESKEDEIPVANSDSEDERSS